MKYYFGPVDFCYAFTTPIGIIFNDLKFNGISDDERTAMIFLLMIHELAHFKRIKTQGNKNYLSTTPQKLKGEAG